MNKNRFFSYAVVVLLLVVLFACKLNAQDIWEIPHKNLKVLPKDISEDQLRSTMLAFTGALGVRCDYCHDDSKGGGFGNTDFASDLKPTKSIAREMLKMVAGINNNYISEVKKLSNNNVVDVNCYTCHRGYPQPKPLQDILFETADKNGIDSALAQYKDLKTKYYGGSAFDFRDNSLNMLGSRLLQSEKVDDALKIAQFNEELFPQSAGVYSLLGEIYMKKGDKQNAVENLKKSLELNPRNRNASEMLRKLETQ